MTLVFTRGKDWLNSKKVGDSYAFFSMSIDG